MTPKQPRTELDARYSSALNPRPGAKDVTTTDWGEAERQLRAAEVFWITTVRPDGRLHVTPLIAAWHEGALYFSTGSGEQKAKNLAGNPHCALTTGHNSLSEGLDIVIEGTAEQVTDPARQDEVIAAFEAQYGDHITSPGGLLRLRRQHPQGQRPAVRGGTRHGVRLRARRPGIQPHPLHLLAYSRTRKLPGRREKACPGRSDTPTGEVTRPIPSSSIRSRRRGSAGWWPATDLSSVTTCVAKSRSSSGVRRIRPGRPRKWCRTRLRDKPRSVDGSPSEPRTRGSRRARSSPRPGRRPGCRRGGPAAAARSV